MVLYQTNGSITLSGALLFCDYFAVKWRIVQDFKLKKGLFFALCSTINGGTVIGLVPIILQVHLSPTGSGNPSVFSASLHPAGASSPLPPASHSSPAPRTQPAPWSYCCSSHSVHQAFSLKETRIMLQHAVINTTMNKGAHLPGDSMFPVKIRLKCFNPYSSLIL